jgi:hypothetical protein
VRENDRVFRNLTRDSSICAQRLVQQIVGRERREFNTNHENSQMVPAVALMLFLFVGNPACSQPAAERNKLIEEAEWNKFTLRRTEFVGLTYTRDQVLRDRMTPVINEGDVFTRDKLLRILRRMSALKRTIYPLRLRNVVIRLDRSDGLVDVTICFRQRHRVN